jgi:Cd2+/Zn2+-exporting ATPase
VAAKRPCVTDEVLLHPNMTADEVLRWAARAEAGSEHPLSRAILDAAKEKGRGVTAPHGQ